MSVHERPWADGTPCWAQLTVPDLEAGRRFYGDLLGWTFDVGPAETGFYSQGLVGGRPAAALGGVMPGGEDEPVAWLTFLATADAAATQERAVAAGARVQVPVAPVMDFGSMAVLTDPAGATVALWQAGRTLGATVVNEPGAMIWNEHLSAHPAEARAFYRAVFGYGVTDMSAPGFEYATVEVDGRPVGGIGGGADAASWEVYFAVTDTDAATERAVRLGGAVVSPASDTTYGRLAGVTGPFGERFWLMSTDEEPSAPAA